MSHDEQGPYTPDPAGFENPERGEKDVPEQGPEYGDCYICKNPTIKRTSLIGWYCGCKDHLPNGFFCSRPDECLAAGRCTRNPVCND